jgi:hypothetical protein
MEAVHRTYRGATADGYINFAAMFTFELIADTEGNPISRAGTPPLSGKSPRGVGPSPAAPGAGVLSLGQPALA